MTKTSPGPDRPAVFVSYSHSPDDEVWRDRLVRHLRSLEREGFEVWHDRRIDGGADWQPEIARAMERAGVAVLLVSADFLGSEFIRETEVPYLLERRRSGTLTILPLIARPCDWRHEAWLAGMQCRPQDGIPLSAGTAHQVDEALAALTAEIRGLLGRGVPPTGATVPVPEGRAGVPPPWEGEGWIRGEARRGALRSAEEPPSPHLDLGRLPTSGPLFVGRERELAQLDAAWEAPSTHVLTFVAFGGVGKSTLVARWLDRMAADGWRGARRVLDWSFYSQGTEERVTSADRFLDYALSFFGDPDPTKGSARDRGLRLAELVRREKTLLVLDGVEPLQHPPGPLAGRLKDPGLAALLKSLAGGNPGLCVVTTRERIADLEGSPQTAPQVDLETLSQETGAELLRQLRPRVERKEIPKATQAAILTMSSRLLSILGSLVIVALAVSLWLLPKLNEYPRVVRLKSGELVMVKEVIIDGQRILQEVVPVPRRPIQVADIDENATAELTVDQESAVKEIYAIFSEIPVPDALSLRVAELPPETREPAIARYVGALEKIYGVRIQPRAEETLADLWERAKYEGGRLTSKRTSR